MNVLGIIPARYASSRFPGKPLADIGGKPMIERVYTQAAQSLEHVWVATDDERIVQATEAFGGKVVRTAHTHRSGTERCAEAAEKIATTLGHPDVVLNIQGDEPFLHPGQLQQLQGLFRTEEVEIGTLMRKITTTRILEDTNTPKVLCRHNGQAIYFSRTPVPFVRGEKIADWLQHHTFYSHIGLYGFRYGVLQKLTQLPPTPLEKAESLEQLRWLEHGYKIFTAETEFESFGVDTPGDIINLRNLGLF